MGLNRMKTRLIGYGNGADPAISNELLMVRKMPGAKLRQLITNE
jgi:hypothetical protein